MKLIEFSVEQKAEARRLYIRAVERCGMCRSDAEAFVEATIHDDHPIIYAICESLRLVDRKKEDRALAAIRKIRTIAKEPGTAATHGTTFVGGMLRAANILAKEIQPHE